MRPVKALDLSSVRSFSIEKDKEIIRIRYRDISGNMRRLSPKLHPIFESVEEAKLWIQSREAHIAGQRAQLRLIKQNADKYKLLSEKLTLYIEHKKKQTKEYKTIDTYMRLYVLSFFCPRGLDSPELWPGHYADFLNFLDDVKSVRKTNLKSETKRKICFWINDFMNFLYENNHTENQIKYIRVPESEDNELTVENSYWFSEELTKIKEYLSEEYYDLLIFGVETGMRISELLSMRNEIYRRGDIPDSNLHNLLIKNEYKYNGYIKLVSQLDKRNDSTYTLAPLKSRDRILDKYARYIPISTKAYEILKKYYNRIHLLGKLSENSVDNLFWPKLSVTSFNQELERACREAGISQKRSHSMRHTAATNILKKTGSELLTKMITGHESDKSFKRYNHLIVSIRDSENKISGLLD